MKRAPEDNKSPDDNALYEEEEEGEELMDDDYIVQLHKYLQEKKSSAFKQSKTPIFRLQTQMFKRTGGKHLKENRSKKKANNTKETVFTGTRRGVKKKDGTYETKAT